ncbi:aminotransferase class V-fold PLP-dependent enzyme [Natronogracilivirga saccharolytica]|nr:aminotransferase class V-fold PLP-dependent enzyme [Natronogracilivirga saccharolytica]
MHPETETDFKLHRFREQFPHTIRGICYMNHAAQSPLAGLTVDAINRHLEERHDGMMMTYPMDMEVIAECRERIRRLVNAGDARQIAFIGNTSEGLNKVTSGLDWNEGDEIILNSIEFPSNVLPYRKLESIGVRCIFVDAGDGTVPVERIEKAITPKTRMVALSAVQFLSGYRSDMEAVGALCRKHGILFVVDGIQAAGVVPVDVQKWGVDAFAAGGLKWLMAPMGIGFLYLSPRLCEEMNTPDPGWLSVEEPWDLLNYHQPLRTDAGRYEGGVTNIPGIYGLNASLGLLLDTGIDAVFSRITTCNRLLRNRMEEYGLKLYGSDHRDHESGIVTFTLPDNLANDDTEQMYRKENIYLSIRDGKLRISPHGYNTPDEIEHVIETTAAMLARGKSTTS